MKDLLNGFKWKHFESHVILLAVRWYLQYSLSYRDIVELLDERGVHVSHTTVMRWVFYRDSFGYHGTHVSNGIHGTTAIEKSSFFLLYIILHCSAPVTLPLYQQANAYSHRTRGSFYRSLLDRDINEIYKVLTVLLGIGPEDHCVERST